MRRAGGRSWCWWWIVVSDLPITWRILAAARPEFVQWVVAREGGVPEGPVDDEHYDRLRTAYLREVGTTFHGGGDGRC